MEKWIIEYTTAQFSSRYLNGTHLFLKWDFSLSIIDKSDFFFFFSSRALRDLLINGPATHAWVSISKYHLHTH